MGEIQAGAAGGSTVNVGIVCGCSGPLASSTKSTPPAYKSYINLVNSQGGINGHKINVIVKDDESNPGLGLSEAKSLVEDDHVVALVDATDTETAWGSYAQQQKVPVIGGFNLSALDITNPDFFSTGTTEDVFTLAQVEAAQKVHAKNIAEFYCAEDPLCAEIVPFLKGTAKAKGENVVDVAEISATLPNYTAQCVSAKQAGADFVSIGSAVTTVEKFAADCAQQGYFPWYEIADGGVSKSFVNSPGLDTKAVGFQTGVPFFVTNTPATKKMNAEFKKYAPGMTSDSNYNQNHVSMYTSAILFADALKAGTKGHSGPVTTQEMYNGLYSLHGDTLEGLAPPLTFKANQPNPVDCWYWIGIAHHKFTTPFGLKPHCEAPPKIS
jgi:branched-chain amino acid transport system substrate-binding protein